jgi:integrase
MLYRLVSSVQRKGSRNRQFVQRIPADVRPRLIGRNLSVPVGLETHSITVTSKMETIRISLRTADPSEAKRRQAALVSHFDQVWAAMREDAPRTLTHQQAVALAGEFYRGWVRPDSERTMTVTVGGGEAVIGYRDPMQDQPEAWLAAVGAVGEFDAASDEARFGAVLDRLLLQRSIGRLDPDSREMVLREIRKGIAQAFEQRARNASGDYSPDPKSERFPKLDLATGAPRTARPRLGITEMVERWWKEAQSAGRARSTHESYRSAAGRLADFLQHDDAARVTPEDIVAFKDHRLAQGVSVKTVGDSDLAGLKSLFGWAVSNRLLSTNPAEAVKVTRGRPVRLRSKSLTVDEAVALLSACQALKCGAERPKTFAAKRWVPWLCAYTGARVGEIVQLRRQDVVQQDGLWVLTITPEAGTVKDKTARRVVLHEHLIEVGFGVFVEASAEGYLFFTQKDDSDVGGLVRATKNRVTEFARTIITDPAVSPNHGLRHLFKTIGREVGIADTILDAICGHAPRSIGASYGDVTLKAQHKALQMFPHFRVSE